MLDRKIVYVVGYASGIAGSDSGSGDGPGILKNSPFISKLAQKGLQLQWGDLIRSTHQDISKLDIVAEQCMLLADAVRQLANQDKFFVVFGGDHSCAIGTWSGVHKTLKDDEALGMIWIDAHMDSHTPETSISGNIHGMPLASLLGYGDTKLTHIMNAKPKLKPENICLIGARSYEEAEVELLKKLNVRVFFMDEIKERGMEVIMKEALAIVKKNTVCFGVTLDIDAIDPVDAPGTGVVESDGIQIKDMYYAIKILANEERLVGLEIAEFDPHRDKNHMTEILISNLISFITIGQKND